MNPRDKQRELEAYEINKAYSAIVEKRKISLPHRTNLIVDDVISLESAFVEWGKECVSAGRVTKSVFRLMLLPAGSIAYIVYRTLLERAGNISHETAILAVAKEIGKRIYHEVLFSKMIDEEVEKTKKTKSAVVMGIIKRAHSTIKAFKHKRAYSIQGLYSKKLSYIDKELRKIGKNWNITDKRDVGLLALYIAIKAKPHKIGIFPVYKRGSKGLLKAVGFFPEYINSILEKDITTLYLMSGSERLMICEPEDWHSTTEGLIAYGEEKEFFRQYCYSRKDCTNHQQDDQI